MAYRPFCNLCDSFADFDVREEFFSIRVRNEEFWINGKRAFCKEHNEELFHEVFDTENQELAFQQYRDHHDLVTVKEIKKAREKFQLS